MSQNDECNFNRDGSPISVKMYLYGIAERLSGGRLKYVPFLVRSIEKIPEDAIVVCRSDVNLLREGFDAQSNELRHILEDQDRRYQEIEAVTGVGQICIHETEKVHISILMHEHDNGTADILLFTTKPNWNPNSRRTINEEESLLAGFESVRRSYLAPIRGDMQDLLPTQTKVPEMLLQKLTKEFEGRYLGRQDLEHYANNWRDSDRKPIVVKKWRRKH
jgi:hypothetical protein